MRSPPSRLHPHSYLQHLAPSILQIIAHALDPPLLKHTFRPPGHRAARRSLLAAASTCHALRDACFPLALRVFRSPELQPLFKADLGQSARELELKVDFLLARKGWWALVRKLDIEIYAKGSCALASKLAQLFTALPHLESISLKLPTYRVFREGFTADLRASIQTQSSVRALCVDACSVWMLPYFTGVREVVVWSWPSEVDRAGGLDRCETTDGWRTFLFGLSNQAPCVTEVEVGGLSIYDVNEILPSLANYLKDVQTLRILHRKESHGSIPLVPSLPFSDEVTQATRALWLDAQSDTDYEGQLIYGKPGAVQRIVYFDLQEECGSCYAPREEGVWKDVGPALVLSAGDVRDQS